MNCSRIFFALALFTGSIASAQVGKLNVAPGSKYEVVSVVKLVSSASVMGQTMETTMDNETIENFDIKTMATGKNEMSAVIRKMKMAISTMGQEMNYDSDKADSRGQLAEAMKDKIGKPFNVIFDDNGKILNEEVVKSAQPDAVVPGMAAPSGEVSLMDMSFIGREIKTDASWPDSVNSTSDKMKTITKGVYKVLSVQNDMATILFSGTQEMNGTVEQMGMEMAMSGQSQVTKEILLDLKTGLVVQSNTKSKGTSNIDVQGMSIPVESEATTTKKIKLLQN